MCQAISGEAVLTGDTVNVLTSDKTDSHTAIRAEHNIPEDSGGPAVIKHTPIELIPVTSLTELSGMEFRFDGGQPDWWTDDMTEEATRQLFQAWKTRWRVWGKELNFSGSLDLGRLAALPENVRLSAGGGLYLGSLAALPENVRLSAGGSLNLSRLAALPENVRLSAGGDLDLSGLAVLPESAQLFAGGHLNLRSLKSIPKDIKIKACKVWR